MRRAAFAIPGDIETPTGGYIYERRLLEALRGRGCDVRHVELPGSFPEPSAADTARTVETLAALPPDFPVILDGFIPGSLDPAGYARIAAPILAVVHHPLALEAGLPPKRAAWLRETERANLARTAEVIVPSPHTKEILLQEYGVAPDRVTVVRPGVDRPEGSAERRERSLILAVGLLHPRKGHDVLIEALAGLRDLDWEAVIVGAAWDEGHAKKLADLVESVDLGARVTLADLVERAELHRFYRQARVFALATRYEGYGLVFDEALAAGVPIVSCRTGAVPETVPAEAGLLVPPDDADAFAEALRKMLTENDFHERCRAAAARAGAALPDWGQAARVTMGVLDRCGARGR